ncbi:hypothetical protein MPCS_01713 (plasmid) [Candidatus Megaera polyxenophila]|nr:hypothetical protein MPCS_01713 [Candidatus Megaera polyxenophila]
MNKLNSIKSKGKVKINYFLKRLIFLQVFLIIFLQFAYANVRVNWMDLPVEKLGNILYLYDSKIDILNTKIQEYHTIPKNNWNAVPKRVKSLIDISTYAQNLSGKIENSYLKSVIIKLSLIAIEKKNYLIQLLELHNGGYKRVYNNLYDASIIQNNYIPLFINNIMRYNHSTQELWGEYILEAVDPCHRRLLNSFFSVFRNKTSSTKVSDFFLWLEDQQVSVFIPAIKMFTEAELAQKKVIIKNGKFYDILGKRITTNQILLDDKPIHGPVFDIEHIFIIDEIGNIYLCYSSRTVGHTSMSHYKPIIGAGKLVLNNGEVKKIAFDSGHYLPGEKGAIQTINFLLKVGIKFKNTIKIEYFKGDNRVSTDFAQFKKEYIAN